MNHIRKLALFLSLSVLIFILCAVGMLTPLVNVATVVGMCLVFAMTCGFFYATLHLSKL